jgi:hypothetical protein
MTTEKRDEYVGKARGLCTRNSGNEIEVDVDEGEREIAHADEDCCVWVRAWVRVPKREHGA